MSETATETIPAADDRPVTFDDLSDRDLRQRQLVPADKLKNTHAVVVGVGAIGRQVAIQLATTGVGHLTLVDHDTVEVVNLAAQGYMPEDLGKSKVAQTAELCSRINPDTALQRVPTKFRWQPLHTGRQSRRLKGTQLAVFCCVDSINARRDIWNDVKASAAFWTDGRMAAEMLNVLASDAPPTDIHYDQTLFRPEEGYVGTCTARSVVYGATLAASLMVCQYTKFLRGLPVDRNVSINLLSMEMGVD
jgi:hypothetical protein